MLFTRLEVDIHTNSFSKLEDEEIEAIADRLDRIDLESLILSRFTAQEISKYGITVKASTA